MATSGSWRRHLSELLHLNHDNAGECCESKSCSARRRHADLRSKCHHMGRIAHRDLHKVESWWHNAIASKNPRMVDRGCVASSELGQKAPAKIRDFARLKEAEKRSKDDGQGEGAALHSGAEVGDFA